MAKIEVFRVVCDRIPAVFRPGDQVTGNCFIQLNGSLSLNELQIKLQGEAEVRWTQTEQRRNHHHNDDHHKNESHTVTYHSCHPCVDMLYMPGSVYQNVLTTGQHNVGFNFQLPIGALPSSFEGTYGHIRYRVKAKIIKHGLFAFDSRTEIPITINSPAFASLQELSCAVTNSNNKTIGFFGSQTVSVTCSIAQRGQSVGTSIPISVTINNQSKKSMTLKATLRQDIDYYADGKHKCQNEKVLQTSGPNITPFSESNQIMSILVPNTIPVVYNCCPIISIKYLIRVTVDIPGSFDLHCELPIILTNNYGYN